MSTAFRERRRQSGEAKHERSFLVQGRSGRRFLTSRVVEADCSDVAARAKTTEVEAV
jgi:hypothetical protein